MLGLDMAISAILWMAPGRRPYKTTHVAVYTSSFLWTFETKYFASVLERYCILCIMLK